MCIDADADLSIIFNLDMTYSRPVKCKYIHYVDISTISLGLSKAPNLSLLIKYLQMPFLFICFHQAILCIFDNHLFDHVAQDFNISSPSWSQIMCVLFKMICNVIYLIDKFYFCVYFIREEDFVTVWINQDLIFA